MHDTHTNKHTVMSGECDIDASDAEVLSARFHVLHACMYVCMYACVHTYMHKHMDVCMCACMFACRYVDMYVCMCCMHALRGGLPCT